MVLICWRLTRTYPATPGSTCCCRKAWLLLMAVWFICRALFCAPSRGNDGVRSCTSFDRCLPNPVLWTGDAYTAGNVKEIYKRVTLSLKRASLHFIIATTERANIHNGYMYVWLIVVSTIQYSWIFLGFTLSTMIRSNDSVYMFIPGGPGAGLEGADRCMPDGAPGAARWPWPR